MQPDLALRLTLISSNYSCLEHIFMVPKVFEPLKFYCILVVICSSGTFKDCWDGCYSELYSGNISVTFSGLACQPWTANTPHEHVYSHRLWGEIVEWIPAENSNYCRDPLGHGGHPYCYTVEPLVKQQQCNVPVCECMYI